jgi:transposase
MIGVDPHKATHTAVAIGPEETELGRVRVRATGRQVDQLVSWAAGFEIRTWAVESAGGLGYLLAQELVAAGEVVVDVPATLAARVRVLSSGSSNKNDPNDAFSVAVAALRNPVLAKVAAADHVEILRLLAKPNTDIGSQRCRVVCRLHAALSELSAAELPSNSTLLTPRSSSPPLPREPRLKGSATNSPSICSTRSAPSTPSSRRRIAGSPTRCGPPKPP